MPFSSALLDRPTLVIIVLLTAAACGSRTDVRPSGGHSTVPLVIVSPPGSSPSEINFTYQLAPDEIAKLKAGIERLRAGADAKQAIAILGEPSRADLTSRMEKPNLITGRLYYYNVRVVDPNEANTYDQQIVLVFDKADRLREIMSSVPEIK